MSLINKGPSIYVANNDQTAINIINSLLGESEQQPFSNIGDALSWVMSQNNILVLNKSFNNIITSGLTFYINPSNVSSYPKKNTTWYDLSGNGINGTLEDSTSYNTSGYMRLNKSTDAFQFGHNLALETQTITISAYINLEDIGDRHTLITKWLGWSFEIHSDGRPYFRLNGPGDLYSTVSIDWGKWYYISGTYNGNGNKRTIALNGSVNNDSIGSAAISYSQGTFNIPYLNNPTNAEGKLGPVEIYNRQLSEYEILYNFLGGNIVTDGLLYALDAGNLVCYESGSTTAYDLSGDTAASLNNVSCGDGYWIGDATYIDTNYFYGPGTTGEFTLEAWFMPDGNMSTWDNRDLGGIFGSGFYANSIGYGIGFIESIDGEYYLGLQVRNYTTTSTAYVQITGLTSWYHIVGTFTRNDYTRAYINGVLGDIGDNKNIGNLTISPSLDLTIFKTSSNYYAGGKGAIFRLYNRPLSDSEVMQNYMAQKNRFINGG